MRIIQILCFSWHHSFFKNLRRLTYIILRYTVPHTQQYHRHRPLFAFEFITENWNKSVIHYNNASAYARVIQILNFNSEFKIYLKGLRVYNILISKINSMPMIIII